MSDSAPDSPSASDRDGHVEPQTAPALTEAQRTLATAEAEFERGDYAALRATLRPLLSSADADGAAARALHRRTTVDPAQVAAVLFCVAVFLFAVGRYVL